MLLDWSFSFVIPEKCRRPEFQIVKLVKDLTGLGLKEAKAVVDAAPGPGERGRIKGRGRENIKKTLEESGAEVELK